MVKSLSYIYKELHKNSTKFFIFFLTLTENSVKTTENPQLCGQTKEKNMNKKQYNVNILVNGRKVREFEKNGMVFIEGREGTKYEINVSNNSNKRILAVITVDGYSVLGDNKEENSGYIIDANDSLKLKGFRLDEEKVSAFVFSKKGESRAQKGFSYAKDCGVIGVKIFQEKENIKENIEEILKDINKKIDKYQPVYPPPIHPPENPWQTPWTNPYPWGPTMTYGSSTTDYVLGSDGNSTCYNTCGIKTPKMRSVISEEDFNKSSVSKNTFDLGTSMGENISSPIKMVDFEVGKQDVIFEIYYASKESLKRNGITSKPKQQVYIPRAFCKKV